MLNHCIMHVFIRHVNVSSYFIFLVRTSRNKALDGSAWGTKDDAFGSKPLYDEGGDLDWESIGDSSLASDWGLPSWGIGIRNLVRISSKSPWQDIALHKRWIRSRWYWNSKCVHKRACQYSHFKCVYVLLCFIQFIYPGIQLYYP